MTTIYLNIGENYISFPLRYEYNFRRLFIQSGIMDYIDSFEKVDPLTNYYIPVNLDLEYTEEGRGYKLTTKTDTSIPPIVYIGQDYQVYMTLDILRSILLKGWNLIGPGSSIIPMPKWCTARDPKTMIPVTRLEPMKAYLMYSEECIPPATEPLIIIFGAGLIISAISLYLTLTKRTTPEEVETI